MTQDLERQLARYGATLRQHARSVPIEEVETRRRSSSVYRPGKAVVTGAVLVLASIGVIFAGLALLNLIELRSEAPKPLVPTSGRTGGPGIVALVVGGAAVALIVGVAGVGLIRTYRTSQQVRATHARERRKRKMQTLEKPIAPIEKLERSNRYLIVALVVVTLLAAGLGAWLVVDHLRLGAEGEIDDLLNEYGAAWEANDGAAVVALMTPGASLTAGNGETYSVAEIESMVDSLGSFTSTPLADNLVVQTADGWYVAAASTLDYAEMTFRVFDVFDVVEQDGRYLIQYHETWGEGDVP